MRIAWWLHRTLIIGLTGCGFFTGAYNGLHLVSYLSRLPGSNIPEILLFALMPVCAILGGLIPRVIFHKWIHPKCPVDGEQMICERITVYPEGIHHRMGKRVSQYR